MSLFTEMTGFRDMITFDTGEQATSTVYSDRLWQWDPQKFNTCCQEQWGDQGQYFGGRSPKSIESFLSDYLGKPIKLVRIEQTENRSTGYPLWRFDYFERDENE